MGLIGIHFGENNYVTHFGENNYVTAFKLENVDVVTASDNTPHDRTLTRSVVASVGVKEDCARVAKEKLN
jgi:hypothetical protein